MKHILSQFILLYLRFFARIALTINKPVIIGIAGSVGKSSTRNALYALLKDYFPTKMIYGNSETGIPLGILGITQHGFSYTNWLVSVFKAPCGILYLRGTKYLVAEMGIDEPYPPKNMEYLLTIIKPNIAISLNVSATHTEQFEKIIKKHQQFSSDKERVDFLIQAIANEDTKIITKSDCELGIYNADNNYISSAINSKSSTTSLQTFGENSKSTITYKDYTVSLSGTEFAFTTEDQTITISFPYILPQEYRELFASVILVGKHLKLSNKQISSALEKNYSLPKGRGSIFSGKNNSLIIDSSYNASKEAVLAFLTLVYKLKKQTKRPVVFLFGDMRELGEESKFEHEQIAHELITVVDYLYCVGPQTQQYVLPIAKKSKIKEVMWFGNAIEAGEYIANHLPHEAIVLVKGSQNTIFLEESIKHFLNKSSDKQKLCRQESYWIETKDRYFSRYNKKLF